MTGWRNPYYRVSVVVVVGVVTHVEKRLDQSRGKPVVAPTQGWGAVVVDRNMIAPRIASEQI